MMKIIIVGAGGMLQYHAKGFRKAGAEIVALVDPVEAVVKAAAEKWNVKNTYPDLATALKAQPDADAVSIITPNRFHAPIAVQALNAGKHVFCEKPPALNAAEMSEMKAAAEKAGKKLMFNFNNRARPESYAMKQLIDDGKVGKINSAQAKWIRRAGIPGFGGWFTCKELSGGGPLIDLLHMLDLALYFMGYPEPAYVMGKTFKDFINDKHFKGPWGIPDGKNASNDVESAIHGFILFKTGQILSVQNSWAEMIEREEVSVTFQGAKAGGRVRRLFGEDGIDATAIDSCDFFTVEGDKQVNSAVKVEACEDMGRLRSAENFVLSVLGKEKPLNTADEALRLMKIIDAFYKSDASNAPVAL